MKTLQNLHVHIPTWPSSVKKSRTFNKAQMTGLGLKKLAVHGLSLQEITILTYAAIVSKRVDGSTLF